MKMNFLRSTLGLIAFIWAAAAAAAAHLLNMTLIFKTPEASQQRQSRGKGEGGESKRARFPTLPVDGSRKFSSALHLANNDARNWFSTSSSGAPKWRAETCASRVHKWEQESKRESDREREIERDEVWRWNVFPLRCMMKMSKTIALAKVQEIDKISDGPRPHTPPCRLLASAAWASWAKSRRLLSSSQRRKKRLRQLQASCLATSTYESSGNAKCKALDFYIKYFPTFAAYLV